jgi:transcriptional regulator with XRE-family HTH domain
LPSKRPGLVPQLDIGPYTKMREARRKKGLSQEYVARAAGTTQPTYSRIESGFIQQPDKEIVRRIAEILEVPIDDLFVEEELEPSPPRMRTETVLDPKDIPAMLRDLKGLLDDGIITDEEFLEKKKELLARL